MKVIVITGSHQRNLGILHKLYQNNKIEINKDLTLKNRGKLFKKSDWRPQMLIKIYSEYKDNIVDLFLNGKIKSETPNLIKIR